MCVILVLHADTRCPSEHDPTQLITDEWTIHS